MRRLRVFKLIVAVTVSVATGRWSRVQRMLAIIDNTAGTSVWADPTTISKMSFYIRSVPLMQRHILVQFFRTSGYL